MADFISLGSKTTAAGDCTMKLKDTPWKESYNQPRQHIKKQRHYFVNKGPSSQGYMVFPVVMYGCEGWTVKKAEHRRIMFLNCGVGEDS